jgi:hypothetical protein
MPPLPEAEYIHEIVIGAVYALPNAVTLIVGEPDLTQRRALEPYSPLLSGEIVLRYGIPLLIPESATLIPGLFVSERGAVLTGREAWEFTNKSFSLFPRADVRGIYVPGGAVKEVFLRELDYAAGPRVLAYESFDLSFTPSVIAQVAVATASTELPELLQRYCPPHPLATLLTDL